MAYSCLYSHRPRISVTLRELRIRPVPVGSSLEDKNKTKQLKAGKAKRAGWWPFAVAQQLDVPAARMDSCYFLHSVAFPLDN